MSYSRDEIVSFMNDYLEVDSVQDVCPNGLQVQGNERISKIVTAVSANLEVFEYAKKVAAELVLVHHGLLWNDEHLTVTGNLAERLGFLLENKINLVAYHLPLDMHTVVGNNILTVKKLGLTKIKPFGEYHGQKIGFQGELKEISLSDLQKKLEKLFGTKAELISGNKKKVKKIAVVSGGGMFALDEAAREVDVLIRGEIHEPTPAFCRETGLAYIGLGHYKSETLGVQELGKLLKSKFKGLQVEFFAEENPY